jgi:hypothetical protein
LKGVGGSFTARPITTTVVAGPKGPAYAFFYGRGFFCCHVSLSHRHSETGSGSADLRRPARNHLFVRSLRKFHRRILVSPRGLRVSRSGGARFSLTTQKNAQTSAYKRLRSYGTLLAWFLQIRLHLPFSRRFVPRGSPGAPNRRGLNDGLDVV